MSLISLYQIPEMDSTYKNVPYFGSKDSQTSWINSKRVQDVLDANLSVEPGRTSVTIDRGYKWLESRNIDYLSLVDSNNKTIYYFIIDYVYKTENATTLILQLDVMQTYMFDIEFNDSFVDRGHVDRYKNSSTGKFTIPAGGTVEENLEFGDMVLSNVSEETFRDKYVISSTTPLGVNDWNRPTEGGGGGFDPGTPSEGELLEKWGNIAKLS